MRKNHLLGLLSFILFFSVSITGYSKDYTMDQVRIFAEVRPDGTVKITEHRTYTFKGSYSVATYELSRRGFDLVRDIQVSEDGQNYILSDSELPGTFKIDERKNRIDIEWNYEARDESRTFVISYILEGALVVGQEHAEFFWIYLSDDWERSTQSLEVELRLPASHNGAAYGWVYGATDQVEINFNDLGFNMNSTSRISRSDEVSVRYLFPSSLVALAVTNPELSVTSILAEEQQREMDRVAREARIESMTPFVKSASIVIIVLSIGLYIWFYSVYGKRYHPSQQIPDVSFRPPAELKPAVASWLLFSRSVVANAMAAMLFDLARQGYFVFKEGSVTTKVLKKQKDVVLVEAAANPPDATKLSPSEKSLYDFVTGRMVEDNRLDKIFSSTNTKLSIWYAEWSKLVSKEGKALDLIDEESVKGMKYSIFTQILMMFLGIGLFILVQIPDPVVAALIAFIMIFVSISIMKYKPHGQELYKRFLSYRNGLKMAAKQRMVSVNTFADTPKDMHLIYAVAFGITGKKLETVISLLSMDQSTLHWMLFPGNPAYVTSSIAKSVGQVTNSIVTSTTAFAGSGASVGVAGGGAGGGAR